MWLTLVLSSSYTLIDIDIHLLDSKQQLESPVKDEGQYYETQSSDSSLFFYFLQPILSFSFSVPLLPAITTVFYFFSLLSISLFLFVSPVAHVRWQQIETADFCITTIEFY